MGGGLDCAEDDSRLGHVGVDDCVDADPVEFRSLADKGNSGDRADSGSRAVDTDDVLGLCGGGSSFLIGYDGGDLVIFDGFIDGETFQRPASTDLATMLLECRAEYVFRVLLADIEAIVEIGIGHSPYEISAAVVDSLAVFVSDVSSSDEADLQHLVQQAELVEHLDRSRVEGACAPVHVSLVLSNCSIVRVGMPRWVSW